ncbi:hypothetical protein AYO44_12120 [Planctomycetaceae bacterium SCGC AG-212-F19]|nr:hypothetical protein AYO44_12120 [Planctomycetaceae bacterium SCGC AG-212-F19]
MPAEDMEMAVGCLRKLPALCESFCLSCESRDVDEILRLERGMLARLAQPTESSPKGRELAKRLNIRFKSLHMQLGLPELNPVKLTTPSQKRKGNPKIP